MPMNPEIKQLWLEALRSDKYKQGNGLLRTFDNKFCCLGVLCDIYTKTTDIGWNDDNRHSYGMGMYTASLDPDVQEWAGVDNTWGYIWLDEEGRKTNLANMNDSGKTFEEIAKVIEENL